MRKTHAACALGAALALLPGVASGQGRGRGGSSAGGSGRQVGPQTMTLQKEQLGTDAFATLARTRMRNGDCAGALDAFDSAILHTTDITLRRDRGLCQEQLGHPFPAMDDYRAYLAQQPDAPDSEGIRARLARLEGDTATVEAPRKAAVDDDIPPNDDVPPPGAPTASGIQFSPSTGEQHDRMDYVEHDNDVLSSSIRRGKGFSLGPYYTEHKWFFSGASFGEQDTFSEGVGLALRYSFGHVFSAVAEGAYEQFNTVSSSDQSTPTITGVSAMLGGELRFPLDATYDNEVFVVPGVGIEALSFAYSGGGPSESQTAFVPEGRAGWRHMLSNSVGFDLALQGGVAVFLASSQNGQSTTPPATPLVAVNLGVLWGL